MYLTRNSHLENIKNSYNSLIKRQPDLKMGKDLNRHFSRGHIQVTDKE